MKKNWRKCPRCSASLFYGRKIARDRAERKSTICRSCVWHKRFAGSFPVYPDGFKKSCPHCGFIQQYTEAGNLNTAKKENTLCIRCAGLRRYGFRDEYRIDDVSKCWQWLGKINTGGYGQKTVRGKQSNAHRIYYEQFKGEIPHGLDIDHLCRNRSCVNPAHLEAVTRTINVRRGLKPVLKESQIREIRRIGKSIKGCELATRFNVSATTINSILKGRTWKDVL